MAEYLFFLINIAAKVQKSLIKRSILVPVWKFTCFEGVDLNDYVIYFIIRTH